MLTSSAKAKGRRLQQLIRDDLRKIGRDYGLVDADLESRQMGGTGTDIVLSPAAEKIFPFSVEAKNQESLNVTATFWKHYRKYEGSKSLKMVVSCKNHHEPIVTVRWKDFLKIYTAWLRRRNGKKEF